MAITKCRAVENTPLSYGPPYGPDVATASASTSARSAAISAASSATSATTSGSSGRDIPPICPAPAADQALPLIQRATTPSAGALNRPRPYPDGLR